MSDILTLIKQASKEGVDASFPVNLVFGVVTSVLPLEIKIDQKITLPEKMLILTNAVKDYQVFATLPIGDAMITIHNALQLGESVALLRMQGGQQFLVIDRGCGS